jgi:hypothetical protein
MTTPLGGDAAELYQAERAEAEKFSVVLEVGSKV